MKKFFTQKKERGNCCENQQKSYKLLPNTKHNGEFMDFFAEHIVDARDIFLLEIKTFFSSPIEIEWNVRTKQKINIDDDEEGKEEKSTIQSFLFAAPNSIGMKE